MSFDGPDGVTNSSYNPEVVTDLTWTDPGGTTHDDYVANSTGAVDGACNGDPSEFFGQSYGALGATDLNEVAAGFTGFASTDGTQYGSSGQVSTSCPATTAQSDPVDTTYTLGGHGFANEIEVRRTFHFQSGDMSASKLRVFVPRLPIGTFGDVVYPTSSSATSTITGGLSDTEVSDWRARVRAAAGSPTTRPTTRTPIVVCACRLTR